MGFILAGAVATLPAWAAGSLVSADSLIRPGDPVYGNPHGSLTIVDFYDIRCPPCRAMAPVFDRLIKADSEIRYVPVDYPILGPASVLGVQALFAARMQGKYKPLRHLLMRQKRAPTMDILHQDAKALGLDWTRLELDMSGDRVAGMVEHNLRRGRAEGIHAIPAMIIGRTRVVGGLSYADLRSVVAKAEKTASRPSQPTGT